MMHSFDVDIAKQYGILEAILLNNIYFWIKKNEANERNFIQGKYWTYSSTRAFKELFPYASERQIKSALKKLREEKILITDNFNENAYDRTLWYALDEKGLSIVQNRPMEKTKKNNGKDAEVPPIPDIKPDFKPDSKPDVRTGGADAPTSTPERHKRSQYGWVKLTDSEYERLIKDFGEETTLHYIAYVDESAQQTGNKNKWKDWNLTVRKAIREKWGGAYSPHKGGYDNGADRQDSPSSFKASTGFRTKLPGGEE